MMSQDPIDGALTAIKETLLIGIGPYRYKNGAFAGAVTPATSVIDDFNIMISSPLVTAREKHVFENVKNWVVKLRNMKARGEEPDIPQLLKDGECAMEMSGLFSAEKKARGEYVPPMMVQTVGENGEIEESILLRDDGGETRYKGGKPGVVPGAPEAYNKAQEEAHGYLLNRHGKKGSDHDAEGATRFEKADTDFEELDSMKRHGPKAATAESEKVKPSQTKPKKAAPFAGLGKSFEGNLKNAFL